VNEEGERDTLFFYKVGEYSMLWVELCSPKFSSSDPLVPTNVILFGNRVFADVIKLR
jgi:hypothetical protein